MLVAFKCWVKDKSGRDCVKYLKEVQTEGGEAPSGILKEQLYLRCDLGQELKRVKVCRQPTWC